MKLLKWFYVVVQFVMLAVSIPKVATLFHAYSPYPIGPSIGGLDITSWMVGIMVDCCAAVTTMAAMNKYGESRNISALIAPAILVLCCTTLSIIANYEDAATLMPDQYKDVSLFTHPALLINPVLISSPPLLVFLLITLVPSVLAKPRLKTMEEIEAEADEAEAKILAQGRIREAKARANAGVMGARIKGLATTVNAARNQPALPAPESVEPDEPDPDPPARALPAPSTKMTRTLWNAMPVKDRITQSGLITPQEVADILAISLSHARNLAKEVDNTQKVDGRSGVPYQELINTLYTRRTKDSFDWARKLEQTLAMRKRRQLQVVPDATEDADTEIQEDEEA